jgi:hypothetical protein
MIYQLSLEEGMSSIATRLLQGNTVGSTALADGIVVSRNASDGTIIPYAVSGTNNKVLGIACAPFVIFDVEKAAQGIDSPSTTLAAGKTISVQQWTKNLWALIDYCYTTNGSTLATVTEALKNTAGFALALGTGAAVHGITIPTGQPYIDLYVTANPTVFVTAWQDIDIAPEWSQAGNARVPTTGWGKAWVKLLSAVDQNNL